MKKLTIDEVNFIIDGEKTKIDSYLLRLFLEERGFGLFQTSKDRKSKKELFLNEDGVIRLYDLQNLKYWITSLLESIDEEDEVFKVSALKLWSTFNNSRLQSEVIEHLQVWSSDGHLSTQYLNIFNDKRDECYVKFQNGVVKITKETIELQPLDVIDGAIWESEIITKDINIVPKSNGLFTEFVDKSVLRKNRSSNDPDWTKNYHKCSESKESLDGLKTGLGFLLHSYNTPDTMKAVVFIDAGSDLGKPEGGNGKTLIMKSLNRLKKVSTQDGKKFRDDPNGGGRFQFADVNLDTKLIMIDDLRPDFKFEGLFSMITGDMEIEGKGTNKFTIPEDRKPKFGATTNYVLMGTGTSVKRRMHIVEFGDYWNQCNQQNESPSDDKHLGKMLFDEFNQDDWDDFHNYLFGCVQSYLKNGLIESDSQSYVIKAIKQKIEGVDGDGVVTQWMIDWISNNINVDTAEDDLFNGFRDEHPFEDSWDKKRFLTGFFTLVMEHKEYDYNAHLSHKGDTKSERRFKKGSAGNQLATIRVTSKNNRDALKMVA